MSSSSENNFSITNSLSEDIVVYNTYTKTQTDPPTISPEYLYPTYTKLTTIAAGATQTVSTDYPGPRLVIAKASNDFPVVLYVPDTLDPQPLTVTSSDETGPEVAYKFYKFAQGEPYATEALQFQEIALSSDNALGLEGQIDSFFQSTTDYQDADYTSYSMVSWWVMNSLYAWEGTYYCYKPPAAITSDFILPDTIEGELVISDESAKYTPTNGDTTDLTLSNGQLASSDTKMLLTPVYRNMVLEGQSATIDCFFTGKIDGTLSVFQPYKNPSLPWWIGAYDFAFATFLAVQIVMAIDMAIHVFKDVANGLEKVSDAAQNLYSKLRSNSESVSEDADPITDLGEDADPVNVDVDVDVDIDTDVVTDTDNVTDTDVDVDIDIDVDIDDDVFAVIDVDVDVDVDIDTDVVTDTDNVTDTDTDTDTDIDTDVDISTGSIKGTLGRIGSWIMEKGLPALVKNLTIMVAFQSVSEILQQWKSQDEDDLNDLSPQQVTGTGMLINYMFNTSNSLTERWNTFADYVEQSSATVDNQKILVTMITTTGNTTADKNMSDFKWSSKSDKEAVVTSLAAYDATADQYKAYQYIASYKYSKTGAVLPLKIACGVLVEWLNKQSS